MAPSTSNQGSPTLQSTNAHSCGRYDIKTPYCKQVKHSSCRQCSYCPMKIALEDYHEAKFIMPNQRPITIDKICHMFYSDLLLETIATYTNEYVKAKGNKIKEGELFQNIDSSITFATISAHYLFI